MQVTKALPPEEERFCITTTQLSELIYESVSKLYNMGYKTADPQLVQMISQIIQFYDKKLLIEGFIENSHKLCWDSINKRDEEFFIKNAGEIFKYLPMDKVDLFKDLFQTKDQNGNHVIEQDLKNSLWKLFDTMIKISIKYVHKGRKPFSTNNGKEVVSKYSVTFFENVDIAHHATLWNVSLEFPLQ